MNWSWKKHKNNILNGFKTTNKQKAIFNTIIRPMQKSLETDLVITGTSHVTDPLHSLVRRLLIDLQETDMQTGSSEWRHSEDNINRRLRPDLILGHLQHLHFSYTLPWLSTLTRESGFLTTSKLTKVPINGLISTVVSSSTESSLRNNISCVRRNRDLKFDILSRDLLTEVSNDLDINLQRSTTL